MMDMDTNQSVHQKPQTKTNGEKHSTEHRAQRRNNACSSQGAAAGQGNAASILFPGTTAEATPPWGALGGALLSKRMPYPRSSTSETSHERAANECTSLAACCFLANSNGLLLPFAFFRIATQAWSRAEPMAALRGRGVLLKHAPGFRPGERTRLLRKTGSEWGLLAHREHYCSQNILMHAPLHDLGSGPLFQA